MKPYITLSLCVALGAALGACSGSDDKKAGESQAETATAVRVQKVYARDVDRLGLYTATVQPQILNNISSSMPNRIKEILVDEGQQVSAGQTVAILDDVNTFSYETQVNNAEANLKNVQVNYDRAVELLKIGGGTRQQVDAMEIQLVNAKNALSQAQRALRNARENTVLTSPIAGVVTARNYDPGDMTGGLPIVTVARIHPVKIVINVTESDFPNVKKGMPATVTFDTYPGEEFSGTVTTIIPTIDTQSRTFGVEVTMPNSDSRILPGMFGRVELNLGTANRVVVPDQAVVKQQGSGNQFVYVLNPADSTVSYNQVILGQRLGDEYELVSGVEPGSEVVVNGQSRLSNGAKVTVAK